MCFYTFLQFSNAEKSSMYIPTQLRKGPHEEEKDYFSFLLGNRLYIRLHLYSRRKTFHTPSEEKGRLLGLYAWLLLRKKCRRSTLIKSARFAAASSCIETGILTLLFPRKRRRSSPSTLTIVRTLSRLEAVATRFLKSLMYPV